MLVQADDLVIIARSRRKIIENFPQIETEAKTKQLAINVRKKGNMWNGRK